MKLKCSEARAHRLQKRADCGTIDDEMRVMHVFDISVEDLEKHNDRGSTGKSGQIRKP